MPEVALVNSDGAEVGRVSLPAAVFEVKPHESLMHSAVISQLGNMRQGTADTKTRTEVSGGGKKPFRQKGTGRARQGSTRAPHWPGGGVVFGPHPRDYSTPLPKKMRRLAMRSAWSVKAADGQLMVLDALKMDAVSTKTLVGVMGKLGVQGKTVLVLAESDDTIVKSARNVPWLTLRIAPSVSTYDLLNADTVVLLKDALAKEEEALA
jgi:large subunit ribosomal protein L4